MPCTMNKPPSTPSPAQPPDDRASAAKDGGVIAVTLALAYRSFRKLGTQLPPPLFPQVADHLEQFLHLRP